MRAAPPAGLLAALLLAGCVDVPSSEMGAPGGTMGTGVVNCPPGTVAPNASGPQAGTLGTPGNPDPGCVPAVCLEDPEGNPAAPGANPRASGCPPGSAGAEGRSDAEAPVGGNVGFDEGPPS